MTSRHGAFRSLSRHAVAPTRRRIPLERPGWGTVQQLAKPRRLAPSSTLAVWMISAHRPICHESSVSANGPSGSSSAANTAH